MQGQPPGPGLPMHEPSVVSCTFGISYGLLAIDSNRLAGELQIRICGLACCREVGGASRARIAPRVIALIDLFQAGISHLQRLPTSITRGTICLTRNSAHFFDGVHRKGAKAKPVGSD
jgi:hypothetical protein